MRHDDATSVTNRRLAVKLFVVVILMFGFGYVLVPLYDVICDITGLNGKTGRIEAGAARRENVDVNRWVTVEFTGSAMAGLPWEFRPIQNKLRVHPGETAVVKYYARNNSDETIVGQAVPSVTPSRAAARFNKIECFCFTKQELKGGEAREMPVRFVVDAGLPAEVTTITLSYAFFNIDKISAKKYSGNVQSVVHDASHANHPRAVATGG